jgi:hypothetical protein
MNTTNTIQKSFLPGKKDVKYVNKDFSSLKADLINFSKTYFPNTYRDFSDSSPGMMFIEMAAYVGDVLSFYTDQAFKEGMIQNATERKNIISLAKFLGYKIKPTKAATAEIELYQLCPSIEDSTGTFIPNTKYTLSIKEYAQFANTSNQYYLLDEDVDFYVNTKLSPREVTVYSRDSASLPAFFLLKKTAKITSGKIVTRDFPIGNLQSFLKLALDEDNILEIISVTDADNNKWYEVDYLAQELILTDVPNDVSFEGMLSDYKNEVPYILKYLRTPRRFITDVDDNNKTFIQFGAGSEGFSDEIVNLSSQTVGVGLTGIDKTRLSFDPSNFLKNESYGISPSNTVITVIYVVGGGVTSNCPSNDVKQVLSVTYGNSTDGLTPDEADLLNTVKNSFKINNTSPATGGKDSETDTEIKQNAMANFPAQNRSVTKEDYLVRVYSMPSKYGSIAKAQVITNNSLNVNIKRMLTGTVDLTNNAIVQDDSINNYFRKITYDANNPFSINLYVLSYDENKNLVAVNDALSANLIKYLKKFRMITDGINIIDGYVINIGVEFSILTYKGYNKKDVLKQCISAVQTFFDIDFWNFSQPINISQLELEIAKIDGVQSVAEVTIVNKNANEGNYSPVEYDMRAATKNKIIYPPIDPAVFEVKYPNSDIKGVCL